MSNNNDSADSLLEELMALQGLLDGEDNIPILDEPFQEAVLISNKPENPFLPKAMIDRLTVEREAAQRSAAEAQRTMQHVIERKQEQARQALNGMGKELNSEQKDTLINELVDELLPQIAGRLRDKLKIMLNR